MMSSYLPIQHIKKDLDIVSGMLTSKKPESIFVDIYSKDPILLEKSKDYMTEIIDGNRDIQSVSLKSTDALEFFIEDQERYDENEKLEALTSYDVFDKMSAEILLLHRYDFILKWYVKAKWLAINPATILLVSRGKLIINILVLAITLLLYKEVPKNSLVVYFIGNASPLYYLIWMPYLFLLYFHMKYLSRLYLLISEMCQIFDFDRMHSENAVVLVEAGASVDEELYKRLLHRCMAQGIHLINYTDNPATSPYADFVLKVPELTNEQSMKYIGVLSGLTLQSNQEDDAESGRKFEYRHIEGFVLESVYKWSKNEKIYPKACHKFVAYYEFLSNRFDFSDDQKNEVAEILARKIFYAEPEPVLQTDVDSGSDSDPEKRNIVEKIGRYL